MTEYKYLGLPLTPTMAAELILPFVRSSSRPLRRIEIVGYVDSKHTQLGGQAVIDVEARVKKALSRLIEEDHIFSPANGFYKLKNEILIEGNSIETPISVEGQHVAIEQIQSERTIGEGQEFVYVYFNSSDRKIAGYENRQVWPCKVGFTAGSVTSRILSQGIGTSMSSLPVVGLVIKSDDGHQLEKALHIALDFACCRMDDAIGAEWFMTSPADVEKWHTAYFEAIKVLQMDR